MSRAPLQIASLDPWTHPVQVHWSKRNPVRWLAFFMPWRKDATADTPDPIDPGGIYECMGPDWSKVGDAPRLRQWVTGIEYEVTDRKPDPVYAYNKKEPDRRFKWSATGPGIDQYTYTRPGGTLWNESYGPWTFWNPVAMFEPNGAPMSGTNAKGETVTLPVPTKATRDVIGTASCPVNVYGEPLSDAACLPAHATDTEFPYGYMSAHYHPFGNQQPNVSGTKYFDFAIDVSGFRVEWRKKTGKNPDGSDKYTDYTYRGVGVGVNDGLYYKNERIWIILERTDLIGTPWAKWV